jgi:Caspase domain
MDHLRPVAPRIVTNGEEPQRMGDPRTGTSTNQQDEVALRDVLEDDILRSIFEGGMKKPNGSWQPHIGAYVLMIWWADELNDMNTSDEVTRLSRVFSEKFGFEVVHGRIENNESLPQQQVAKNLANFVYEYDRPSHLLIIYYAGHGVKGGPGELKCTGTR